MPNHTSALQLVSKYLSDTFSGVRAWGQGGLEPEGCCCMDCSPAVARRPLVAQFRLAVAAAIRCMRASAGYLASTAHHPSPAAACACLPAPLCCCLWLPLACRILRRKCTGWATGWCTGERSASRCSSGDRLGCRAWCCCSWWWSAATTLLCSTALCNTSSAAAPSDALLRALPCLPPQRQGACHD